MLLNARKKAEEIREIRPNTSGEKRKGMKKEKRDVKTTIFKR